MREPVLCYVKEPWAYFTTQELSRQWGDDWNGAPYEHNAGPPCAYAEHDKEAGREPWEIVKVAWDGDFETPSCGHCNSPFTVEQINSGAIAWLRTSRWIHGKACAIPAGTTLARFRELIRAGGGFVYESTNNEPKGNQ